MADATTVRTPDAAFEAALIVLAEQYTEAKANSNHILAPFIEGPPGIGKTEITVQLAEQLGIDKILVVSCGVIDTNLEFIGLPEIIREAATSGQEAGDDVVAAVKSLDTKTGEETVIDVGTPEKIITKWIKPERLAEFDQLKSDERGLLVFDDTHFLLERQQAMMMQLLTNKRTIHTHKVGDGSNVGIMFLGNRMDDNAGAQEMLAPVIDRIKRIVIDVDAVAMTKSWCAWAETQNVHPSIIGYLTAHPEMSYTFQPESDLAASEDSQKFASPRGWKALSDEMHALEMYSQGGAEANATLFQALPKASPEIQERLQEAAHKWLNNQLSNYASGTIGVQAAREYSAYFSVYQKYELDAYLSGKKQLSSIPNDELPVALVRFASSLAQSMHQFDVDLENVLLNYAAKNCVTSKNFAQMDPKMTAGLQKLKTTKDVLELTPEERQKFLDIVMFSLFLDEDLVKPPHTVLNAICHEITEMTDEQFKSYDFEKLLKEKLHTALAGLKDAKVKRLEKTLLQQLVFFEKLLTHTQEAAPERAAQLNSAFIGGFVAELDKSRRKQQTDKLVDSPLRQSTARHAIDMFVTHLLRQSPQILHFLSDRMSISALSASREAEAQEAAPKKKSAAK